jgi:hypothetical protein
LFVNPPAHLELKHLPVRDLHDGRLRPESPPD